jgi:BirA family biotin operon repressor/biotin-[acetyl-CoA-carboxylase] ligase
LTPFAGGRVDPAGWAVLENLVSIAEISSSNDLARELIELYFAEEQALAATLLVAESQPSARGRRGKAWAAPVGMGLYLTLVKRSRGEPLSVIPIATARWLRDMLEEQTGVSARLKWPNDLYVGRRKLAGVLSEARTQGEETYVAVGIGLNVKGPAAALGMPHATTLEDESGKPIALAPLLQAVADGFDRRLSADFRGEEEVAAWQKASVHRPGDRLTVQRDEGAVSGSYLGLDERGFLRLETASGENRLTGGEVSEW